MKIGLGITSSNKIKPNVKTSDKYTCKADKDMEKKKEEERKKLLYEIEKRE